MIYPVYVPSKGRADHCLTARWLDSEGVSFRLVVEPQERDAYVASWGQDRVLALPFSDRGSVIPARNWIWEHSVEEGHARHWELDDNIEAVKLWVKRKRKPLSALACFDHCEEFVDRYENVALAGLRNTAFGHDMKAPFDLNKQVYCFMLIQNDLPFRWRGVYAEDTDMSLQALTGGYCTILFNAFQFVKQHGRQEGGNADLYSGDGKLAMVRDLQSRWPHLVKLVRRFDQPRMDLSQVWRKFDTPLIRRDPT